MDKDPGQVSFLDAFISLCMAKQVTPLLLGQACTADWSRSLLLQGTSAWEHCVSSFSGHRLPLPKVAGLSSH